ncbi:MAG: hypothetical protein AB9M53_08375 [Leptothrix sp. (in: b-proteobacteria)]
MENARHINDKAGAPGTGAVIVGDLPTKRHTVTAEVLAGLLTGEKLTGLETVFSAGTTRLAAVVGRLQSDYGWHIPREDRAAGCKDGRVAWVACYWLPLPTIEAARAAGAGEWCREVRAARLALRTQAAKARRAAERANAARLKRPPPGQGGLFDGEGVTA